MAIFSHQLSAGCPKGMDPIGDCYAAKPSARTPNNAELLKREQVPVQSTTYSNFHFHPFNVRDKIIYFTT
jgi:hypothetical protein